MYPVVLDFHFPDLPHIHCIFTTRLGGKSTGPFGEANLSLDVGDDPAHVLANRIALKEHMGVVRWQELRQVHGCEVLPDNGEDDLEGSERQGDGLYTDAHQTALVIKTADCQPILLTDTHGRALAALHCGWRGNAANFPGHGVRAFCAAYGLDPSDVLAIRGPSLGPGQSEFRDFASTWDPMFRCYWDPTTRCINLWQLTRDQLMAAGVPGRQIFSIDLCTRSSPLFFSYRRSVTTGRQAGIIWKD
jgi:YfiH family protein